jgi:eukaryotic translation initiation factor 2C
MTAFVKPGNLAQRLFQWQDSTGALPTLSEEMTNSIKVRTRHLGHKKRIKAIGATSARRTRFDCEEFGGKILVEDYFKRSKPLSHTYSMIFIT